MKKTRPKRSSSGKPERSPSNKPEDRTRAYAEGVVSGKILAGRLVRLACQRHIDDLENGKARGLRWDQEAADHVIGFIESCLRLTGGEHEGRPFRLSPWQVFIVGSLFGWKGRDGYRRFRRAYVEIAKGNGKSPLAAAIGLFMLTADGEARAEVYAAATKRDQAMILFRDAVAMVDQSPAISKRVSKTGAPLREWNLSYLETGSWFRPISSDDGQSGPRPHCGLIDEIHEHKTPNVIEMMRAGTKGRTQALILEITNSGHDKDSVCWKHHEYTAELLLGKKQNDAWFGYICGIDPCDKHQEEGRLQPVDGCADCDDWRNEKVWTKANPNLDVSVTRKYLREQVNEAVGMPSKEGSVKRLNFCVWTETEVAWISSYTWSLGSGPIRKSDLLGCRCYGGLDMASKIDLAAFAKLFPDHPDEGHYSLLVHCWIPRKQAELHEREHGIPYSLWEREGWVTITPGDVIDHDAIEEAIKRDARDYELVETAFDTWNAVQISIHLQQYGMEMREFTQNLRSFNEPSKLFEALLKEGKIHHGDNPLLSLMAGNVSIVTDRSGNIRPVKPDGASSKKIDGIVATIMALGRAMQAPENSTPGIHFL